MVQEKQGVFHISTGNRIPYFHNRLVNIPVLWIQKAIFRMFRIWICRGSLTGVIILHENEKKHQY